MGSSSTSEPEVAAPGRTEPRGWAEGALVIPGLLLCTRAVALLGQDRHERSRRARSVLRGRCGARAARRSLRGEAAGATTVAGPLRDAAAEGFARRWLPWLGKTFGCRGGRCAQPPDPRRRPRRAGDAAAVTGACGPRPAAAGPGFPSRRASGKAPSFPASRFSGSTTATSRRIQPGRYAACSTSSSRSNTARTSARRSSTGAGGLRRAAWFALDR